MKAFGKCRDANSCQQRHLVIPELDRPGASPRYIALPRSGEVKVSSDFGISIFVIFSAILRLSHASSRYIALPRSGEIKVRSNYEGNDNDTYL